MFYCLEGTWEHCSALRGDKLKNGVAADAFVEIRTASKESHTMRDQGGVGGIGEKAFNNLAWHRVMVG